MNIIGREPARDGFKTNHRPRPVALVTNSAGDGGLVAIRELKRAGFDVVGVDARRLPFGFRSRFAVANHRLPDFADPAYDDALLDIVGTCKPDVFLPLDTPSVRAACRHRVDLEKITACNVPRYDAFTAAYDKQQCATECRALGIPTPADFSLEEALPLAAAGVALVVKPRYDVGAARGVSCVRTAETLKRAIAACETRFGPVVIQEYIPGDVNRMRTALLLFNRGGQLAAAFTTQKIRQWPASGGLTAVSRSTKHRELVQQILPFFTKWSWQGAAEVEFKHDERDNRFKVIEINPRFAAYMRFPIRCGLNLPALAARLAVDSNHVPANPFEYAEGVAYINPALFVRTIRADVRTHRSVLSAARGALRDARGLPSMLIDMLSDPLPMLGNALADLRRHE